MYYYLPTPEAAAESIQILTGIVPFGNLIRNMHYWSAQFLVIVVMVHLLRIILTGGYAPPRRFNYVLGLILLVLILLLDFTGMYCAGTKVSAGHWWLEPICSKLFQG